MGIVIKRTEEFNDLSATIFKNDCVKRVVGERDTIFAGFMNILPNFDLPSMSAQLQ